jgi:GNAT superfamily N-acetyltransferase
MERNLIPAAEMSNVALATLFTHAFTGYIGGSVQLDALAFAGLVYRDNLDLGLSRIMLVDQVSAGIALLSRQGWSARVAAMGIAPEFQEQRLGGWFMEQIIVEAVSRGDRHLELEAFEQNIRAVKLYTRVGFRVLRRLYGYTAETIPAVTAPELTEVDISEVAQRIIREGLADLPWQVSGTALARHGMPNRAYRLKDAWCVIADPSGASITLRALMVAPSARRHGSATRLIQALAAANPGKPWNIPQLCPEEYAPFFEKCGFVRKPLHQVHMVRALI